jgi:hypothetical protein
MKPTAYRLCIYNPYFWGHCSKEIFLFKPIVLVVLIPVEKRCYPSCNKMYNAIYT